MVDNSELLDFMREQLKPQLISSDSVDYDFLKDKLNILLPDGISIDEIVPLEGSEGEFLIKGNIYAGDDLDDYDDEGTLDMLNALNGENESLKLENRMLKVTIGRNEAYISKLKNDNPWRN